MDVACPAKHPRFEARTTPPGRSCRYRLAPQASTSHPSDSAQVIDTVSVYLAHEMKAGARCYFGLFELPEPDGVVAGDAPGVSRPPWPEDWNRPCTRPDSDSTRDTPVVMSTISRSPRSTFLPCVSTTPPTMVIRLVLVSNTAVSPVTTWSFWVTTTLPRASSRLIDELPPGPGAAAGIGAGFAGFPLAAGAAAG